MERQKYDVAVSYASEQRPYVERFVARLQSQKMRVYYDRNAQAKMVGKILDQELHRIYLQESNCCILFLSNAYSFCLLLSKKVVCLYRVMPRGGLCKLYP